MRTIPAFLTVLALASAGAASAQEFRLKEVAAVTAVAPAEIAPRTIIFSDHKGDELADLAPGSSASRIGSAPARCRSSCWRSTPATSSRPST